MPVSVVRDAPDSVFDVPLDDDAEVASEPLLDEGHDIVVLAPAAGLVVTNVLPALSVLVTTRAAPLILPTLAAPLSSLSAESRLRMLGL